jgi:hypothetical protein
MILAASALCALSPQYAVVGRVSLLSSYSDVWALQTFSRACALFVRLASQQAVSQYKQLITRRCNNMSASLILKMIQLAPPNDP